MRLIREVTEGVPQPATPEEGWNVGHLAHHGILLSCDGFVAKLDLEQLNVLFDYAEDGESGEIRDHDGDVIYVEVNDNNIVLSRDGDETYPSGVVLDLDTLKEMGIEQHDAATSEVDGQPTTDDDDAESDDTMDSEAAPEEEAAAEPDEELEEGVKRAYKRVGNKIKRGFRVTSGWRKGRVVSSAKAASAPRAKAKTRMKLKIAAKRKKIVRILKGKRTRKKSASKRLATMNKRASGK
jgi:hypothetical protein